MPQAIDGSVFSAFELYATAGLFQAHHVDPARFLDERGLALLPKVENNCVIQLGRLAFVRSATLTTDGRPLAASFTEEPLRSMLAANRIGNRRPSGPVLLTHSVADDVIPYPQGRRLAREWCAKGGQVWFQPLLTPTHLGGTAPTALHALSFFDARFRGDAPLSNCAMLP